MKRTPAGRDIHAGLARERGRFLSFLESRLGSRAEAEEILQAAYVKGLESIGALKDEGKATAWFYRLLRNALADHWRRKAAEARAVRAYRAETARRAALTEEKLHRRVCRCVSALVDTLKPEYAEALRGVDLEDASVRDFAERAGVTANSAAVRLHRARRALKRRLLETCGKCAEHGCRDCDCARL